MQVSSVHMTFNTVEEWELARESPGWLSRMGVQFHWENDGYKCVPTCDLYTTYQFSNCISVNRHQLQDLSTLQGTHR